MLLVKALLKISKTCTRGVEKSRGRNGVTYASAIGPSLHLYSQDDAPPSTNPMIVAPCPEVFPLHCHYYHKHLWIEGLT